MNGEKRFREAPTEKRSSLVSEEVVTDTHGSAKAAWSYFITLVPGLVPCKCAKCLNECQFTAVRKH